VEKPLVYIAGPIKSVGMLAAQERNQELASQLSALGIASYDPASSFWFPDDGTDDAVDAINTEAIRQCDVFVAFWQGVPSNGTDAEIAMAIEGNLPIVIVNLVPPDADLYGYLWDIWEDGHFPNPGDWLPINRTAIDTASAARAVSRVVQEELESNG